MRAMLEIETLVWIARLAGVDALLEPLASRLT
jgi:hypothetical protein